MGCNVDNIAVFSTLSESERLEEEQAAAENMSLLGGEGGVSGGSVSPMLMLALPQCVLDGSLMLWRALGQGCGYLMPCIFSPVIHPFFSIILLRWTLAIAQSVS